MEGGQTNVSGSSGSSATGGAGQTSGTGVQTPVQEYYDGLKKAFGDLPPDQNAFKTIPGSDGFADVESAAAELERLQEQAARTGQSIQIQNTEATRALGDISGFRLGESVLLTPNASNPITGAFETVRQIFSVPDGGSFWTSPSGEMGFFAPGDSVAAGDFVSAMNEIRAGGPLGGPTAFGGPISAPTAGSPFNFSMGAAENISPFSSASGALDAASARSPFAITTGAPSPFNLGATQPFVGGSQTPSLTSIGNSVTPETPAGQIPTSINEDSLPTLNTPFSTSDAILDAGGSLPSTEEVAQQLNAMTPEQLKQSRIELLKDIAGDATSRYGIDSFDSNGIKDAAAALSQEIADDIRAGVQYDADTLNAARVGADLALDTRTNWQKTTDWLGLSSAQKDNLNVINAALDANVKAQGLSNLAKEAVSLGPLPFESTPEFQDLMNTTPRDSVQAQLLAGQSTMLAEMKSGLEARTAELQQLSDQMYQAQLRGDTQAFEHLRQEYSTKALTYEADASAYNEQIKTFTAGRDEYLAGAEVPLKTIVINQLELSNQFERADIASAQDRITALNKEIANNYSTFNPGRVLGLTPEQVNQRLTESQITAAQANIDARNNLSDVLQGPYGDSVAATLASDATMPEDVARKQALQSAIAQYGIATRELEQFNTDNAYTPDSFKAAYESDYQSGVARAEQRIAELSGALPMSPETQRLIGTTVESQKTYGQIVGDMFTGKEYSGTALVSKMSNGLGKIAESYVTNGQGPTPTLFPALDAALSPVGLAKGIFLDPAANTFGFQTIEQQTAALFRSDSANTAVRILDTGITVLNATFIPGVTTTFGKGLSSLGDMALGKTLSGIGSDLKGISFNFSAPAGKVSFVPTEIQSAAIVRYEAAEAAYRAAPLDFKMSETGVINTRGTLETAYSNAARELRGVGLRPVGVGEYVPIVSASTQPTQVLADVTASRSAGTPSNIYTPRLTSEFTDSAGNILRFDSMRSILQVDRTPVVFEPVTARSITPIVESAPSIMSAARTTSVEVAPVGRFNQALNNFFTNTAAGKTLQPVVLASQLVTSQPILAAADALSAARPAIMVPLTESAGVTVRAMNASSVVSPALRVAAERVAPISLPQAATLNTRIIEGVAGTLRIPAIISGAISQPPVAAVDVSGVSDAAAILSPSVETPSPFAVVAQIGVSDVGAPATAAETGVQKSFLQSAYEAIVSPVRPAFSILQDVAQNIAFVTSAQAASPGSSYTITALGKTDTYKVLTISEVQQLVGKPPETTGASIYRHCSEDRYNSCGLNGSRLNASGQFMNINDFYSGPKSMTVAHKTLPFGTVVELRYNGNTTLAQVNNRGPFHPSRELDMTPAVAEALGFPGRGSVEYSIVRAPTSQEVRYVRDRTDLGTNGIETVLAEAVVPPLPNRPTTAVAAADSGVRTAQASSQAELPGSSALGGVGIQEAVQKPSDTVLPPLLETAVNVFSGQVMTLRNMLDQGARPSAETLADTMKELVGTAGAPPMAKRALTKLAQTGEPPRPAVIPPTSFTPAPGHEERARQIVSEVRRSNPNANSVEIAAAILQEGMEHTKTFEELRSSMVGILTKSTNKAQVRDAYTQVNAAIAQRVADNTATSPLVSYTRGTTDMLTIETLIDSYLWSAYVRTSQKIDSSGNFTWKDIAGALNANKSLRDYAIGGMSLDFKKRLYFTGKGMDAEGIKWSFLAAYRGPERPAAVAGVVASSPLVSRHYCGGYEKGCAADLGGAGWTTTVERNIANDRVWKWLAKNGDNYALRTDFIRNDPAHVQPGRNSKVERIQIKQLAQILVDARRNTTPASPQNAQIASTPLPNIVDVVLKSSAVQPTPLSFSAQNLIPGSIVSVTIPEMVDVQLARQSVVAPELAVTRSVRSQPANASSVSNDNRQTIELAGRSEEDVTQLLQKAYDAGLKKMLFIYDSNPRVIASLGEAEWSPRDPNVQFSGPAWANQFLVAHGEYNAVPLPSNVASSDSIPDAVNDSAQTLPPIEEAIIVAADEVASESSTLAKIRRTVANFLMPRTSVESDVAQVSDIGPTDAIVARASISPFAVTQEVTYVDDVLVNFPAEDITALEDFTGELLVAYEVPPLPQRPDQVVAHTETQTPQQVGASETTVADAQISASSEARIQAATERKAALTLLRTLVEDIQSETAIVVGKIRAYIASGSALGDTDSVAVRIFASDLSDALKASAAFQKSYTNAQEKGLLTTTDKERIDAAIELLRPQSAQLAKDRNNLIEMVTHNVSTVTMFSSEGRGFINSVTSPRTDPLALSQERIKTLATVVDQRLSDASNAVLATRDRAEQIAGTPFGEVSVPGIDEIVSVQEKLDTVNAQTPSDVLLIQQSGENVNSVVPARDNVSNITAEPDTIIAREGNESMIDQDMPAQTLTPVLTREAVQKITSGIRNAITVARDAFSNILNRASNSVRSLSARTTSSTGSGLTGGTTSTPPPVPTSGGTVGGGSGTGGGGGGAGGSGSGGGSGAGSGDSGGSGSESWRNTWMKRIAAALGIGAIATPLTLSGDEEGGEKNKEKPSSQQPQIVQGGITTSVPSKGSVSQGDGASQDGQSNPAQITNPSSPGTGGDDSETNDSGGGGQTSGEGSVGKKSVDSTTTGGSTATGGTRGAGTTQAPPSSPSPARVGGVTGLGSFLGGGNSNSFSQGGMSLLGTLFQSFLKYLIGAGTSDVTNNVVSPQSASVQPITIVGTVVANPSLIDAGSTTTLSWSSVGTDVSSSTCAVISADFAVIHRGGQNGSIGSPALTESTRFGLVCNTRNATDKLLHETLVRVKGDDSDPPRIFTPEEIARSQSTPANIGSSGVSSGGGGSGSSGGQSGNPAPQDVRTCDPEQSMDAFIRCLCQVEPNPAGCTIPPGGLR